MNRRTERLLFSVIAAILWTAPILTPTGFPLVDATCEILGIVIGAYALELVIANGVERGSDGKE